MAEVLTQGFQLIQTFLNSSGIDELAISNRQALLDAWRDSGSGNGQTFADLLDPDVIFHEAECLPYGGTYFGRDEALRVFYGILDNFWSLISDTHDILTSGNFCVSFLTMTFRVRKDSEPISMPVTEVFQFRNRRIIDWRVHYFDASVVANALKP